MKAKTVRPQKVAEVAGEPCNGVGAVTRIEESARQIDQIIGVIAEMSLQTNLMALNASLHAARADDPAKDFAWVTPEVCALVRIAPSARPAAGRRS
jgi:methyl-accepting chemotaxis protein